MWHVTLETGDHYFTKSIPSKYMYGTELHALEKIKVTDVTEENDYFWDGKHFLFSTLFTPCQKKLSIL
jgi:hypothetical protein